MKTLNLPALRAARLPGRERWTRAKGCHGLGSLTGNIHSPRCAAKQEE